MTNDDLEQRLRAWYLVEISERASAPVELRTANATLAQAATRSRRRFPASWSFPRITRVVPFAFAAAALLVALAIGVGLLVRPSSDVGPLGSPTPTPSTTPSRATAQPSIAETPAATPGPKLPVGGGLMLVTAVDPDPNQRRFDVFTLDAGTGEQTLLGTLPRIGSFSTYDFQWGTDRKHVLITARSGAGPVALENLTEAGRDLTIVCCEPIPDGGKSLSPQSERIAVYLQGSSAVPRCLLCADVAASVVVVDVDGGSRRTIPLADGTLGAGSPSWSPDGAAVVVLGCRPCNIAGQVASAAGGSGGNWAKLTPTAVEHAHLFIVPVDGSPVRELFDAKETTFSSAAWSPTGSTIAFVRSTCPAGEHAPYCELGPAQLVTMTVSDGQPTVLADMAGDVAWSPDGRRLMIGATSGLFVMDADGSHLTKVTAGHATEPRWSPDGAWLVFSTYDEAQFSFEGPWIVPADGGEPRLLGAYEGWAW